ncbi:RNASEH1 [Mytilus edulis]|uniref:ribonuclease H n=1 Tax=Mytilus edulis TaxID=6550 RepID=A0A8S3PZ70_MYTED|nr:RNASEH1 [Mytilus edulis]
MILQAEDMKVCTGVDVNGIEAEFQFNGIQRYKSPPDYWKNLGNSKSRSTDQKNQIHCIAFTDGSCLGSPGPVGAGAVIFPSNNQPQIEISKAVSKKGSILLGELIAIKLVVDHFLISENRQNTDSITLFSDSQTSIGILTLNWKSENYIKVIREIKKNMKVLKMNGIPLNFEWTPGHADIQGNDIADSLAKKGAKEAEKNRRTIRSNQAGYKTCSKRKCFKKMAEPMGIKSTWQKLLQLSSKSLLRTGYCDLNDYKSKIIPSSDKNCSCGEPETVEHYLLHCSNYEEARERMRTSIYFITGNIHMDLDTLLGIDEEDINRDNRNEILCHLENYLTESGRFKNTIQQKTL